MVEKINQLQMLNSRGVSVMKIKVCMMYKKLPEHTNPMKSQSFSTKEKNYGVYSKDKATPIELDKVET